MEQEIHFTRSMAQLTKKSSLRLAKDPNLVFAYDHILLSIVEVVRNSNRNYLASLIYYLPLDL